MAESILSAVVAPTTTRKLLENLFSMDAVIVAVPAATGVRSTMFPLAAIETIDGAEFSQLNRTSATLFPNLDTADAVTRIGLSVSIGMYMIPSLSNVMPAMSSLYTVTVHSSSMSALTAALIFAVPALTAVTLPSDVTVATAGVSDDHVIESFSSSELGYPDTSSWKLSPS